MVDVVVFRERGVMPGPVDRTRRGVDEVAYLALPAPFQHVQKAGEVGVPIGMGIVDGIAHACLGGKMDYSVEAVVRKKIVDVDGRRNIQQLERKRFFLPESIEPGFLEAYLIVIVQIVDADDLIASVEKS